MKDLVIGEFRQNGPNVEVWNGTEWELREAHTTVFFVMCKSCGLSTEETLAQAKLRSPDGNPQTYIKEQLKILGIIPKETHMQDDLFEAKEDVYLRELVARKEDLKKELEYTLQEIRKATLGQRTYQVGEHTYLGVTTKGGDSAYLIKIDRINEGPQLLARLSLDLLGKALEELKSMETQNETTRDHSPDGSKSTSIHW